MKKIVLLLFFLILVPKVFAAHIDPHKTTNSEKNIMISINPEIDIDPDSQTTYFHFDLGLTNRLDMNLKYGVGTKKPYYGLHFSYHFIKSSFLNFTTKVGTHYRGSNVNVADLGFIFGHKFEKCSVSFGPDIQWRFTGNKELMLEVFLAISIPLPKSMSLSFSIDLPIKNQSYCLSTGLAAYF